jgi:hypothetical protein
VADLKNQLQWKILSNEQWNIQDMKDKKQFKRFPNMIYTISNSYVMSSNIRRFIQDEKFKAIHDFEDHLVDISIDWIK